MIRNASLDDSAAITNIYNYYVLNTEATFETEAVSTEEMSGRMRFFIAQGPCLVMEEDGELTGFCYAHPWKERAAYHRTFEVTIYLRRGMEGGGRGSALMKRLLEECRKRDDIHALISCITAENLPSRKFHEKMGFVKVSDFKEVGTKFGRWYGVTDYEIIL